MARSILAVILLGIGDAAVGIGGIIAWGAGGGLVALGTALIITSVLIGYDEAETKTP